MHNTSSHDVLAMVKEFCQQPTNTDLCNGYLNPEIITVRLLWRMLNQAGVDGILTVDLPPEESECLVASLKAHQLGPNFLLAPTTTDDRIASITAAASGYVYYVSLKGGVNMVLML